MNRLEITYIRDIFTAYDAQELVKRASKFKSQINLIFDEKRVNVKSIIGLISIGLKKGDKFFLMANGVDEQQAIKNIKDYFI